MKQILLGIALGVAMSSAGTRAQAQRANESPLDSARAALAKPDKDPTTATVLAFVPGVGHLYAEDLNRGWLIILLYSVGAGISMSGRTDNVGKVGGALAVGGFLFSVIDAGNAARRYNSRMAKLRAAAGADTLPAAAAFDRNAPDAPRRSPLEPLPDR